MAIKIGSWKSASQDMWGQRESDPSNGPFFCEVCRMSINLHSTKTEGLQPLGGRLAFGDSSRPWSPLPSRSFLIRGIGLRLAVATFRFTEDQALALGTVLWN